MSYNVICDRCGFQYKDHQLMEEWTGLMVCGKCWEPRHPQDFVRGVKDTQKVPYTRPENLDISVAPDRIQPTGGFEIPTGNFTTNNSTP